MSISTGTNDKYDEVIKVDDGETFDMTNVAGDTLAGPNPVTVGKDYQVEKIKVVMRFGAEEPEQTNQTGANVTVDFAEVRNQLSIRSQYASTGSDGELPSGVVYDENTWCNPPGSWEDETNASGAAFSGYTDVITFERDIEDIPMWSGSLEEGAELQMHWQVKGITDAQVQISVQNYLFVTDQN